MPEATGKVYPVHDNVFKFGTKGLSSVDDESSMSEEDYDKQMAALERMIAAMAGGG